MDLRWPVVAALNLLLFHLAAEANHFLSPLGVAIFPAALTLPFAALRLAPRPGLVATAISGLALDALVPGPAGLQFFTFLLLHLLLLTIRGRVAPPDARRLAAAGLAVVAVHVLVLAAATAVLAGRPAAGMLVRLLFDGTLTIVVAALAGPWFMALQEAALTALGFPPRDQQEEPVRP